MTGVHFENEVLSVVLPDGWVDRSDGDELAFENPGENEDLIVSLGIIKEPMDADAVAEIVRKLLEHKYAALGKISVGTYRKREASQPPPAIPYVAGFAGYDSRNSIYSSVRVVADAVHFFSASYYLHGCKIVTSETLLRANAVLDLCRRR